MRALLLTNEFPPNIYGGAGVHVEYLSRELAARIPVEVRSFHDQQVTNGNLTVRGTRVDAAEYAGCPKPFVSALKALRTDLAFVGQGSDADVVHCHTWYTHFGGILAKMLYGIPMVLTVHSLEPLRPWKREQLGNAYELSAWVEKTALEMADAVIAVSSATKDDVLRLFDVPENRVAMIPNGIDVDEYRPVEKPDVLRKHGVDPNLPFVLFVGRMTRQKGIVHLLRAVRKLDPGTQVVLAAGDADTPEMQDEMEGLVRSLQAAREHVIWIPGMLPRDEVIALYAHATVFCCPSVYEPFGIINLEAMACGTPVVASATGGILEVVVDGETGLLVDPDLSPDPPHDPRDAAGFAAGLAQAINRLVADPALAARMAAAGRKRTEDIYSWGSVAEQTIALYQRLIGSASP